MGAKKFRLWDKAADGMLLERDGALATYSRGWLDEDQTIAFSRRGNRFFTVKDSGEVCAQDIPVNTAARCFDPTVQTEPFTSAFLTFRRVVGATANGPIESFGLLRGNAIRATDDFEEREVVPRGGPGPQLLRAKGWDTAALQADGQLHLYNRGGWDYLIPVRPRTLELTDSLLAAGFDDGSVRVYDKQGGLKTQLAQAHPGPVRETHLDERGEKLLTLGETGPARLWVLPEGKPSGTFPPTRPPRSDARCSRRAGVGC